MSNLTKHVSFEDCSKGRWGAYVAVRDTMFELATSTDVRPRLALITWVICVKHETKDFHLLARTDTETYKWRERVPGPERNHEAKP